MSSEPTALHAHPVERAQRRDPIHLIHSVHRVWNNRITVERPATSVYSVRLPHSAPIAIDVVSTCTRLQSAPRVSRGMTMIKLVSSDSVSMDPRMSHLVGGRTK
jgi:hypothetical protein